MTKRVPALAVASRTQLAVAGVSIGTAAILLGLLARRIVGGVDLLQWWVPLVLLAGAAAADFASGIVHWSADTWGRSDLPLIGRRVLLPFRIHHLDPDDFAGRCFLDTNGDVAALTIPALTGLVWLPLDSAWREMLAVFGFALCTAGAMTNQIHQWAHIPAPPAPVRVLQQWRVLLRPRNHAAHHDQPYSTHYCITTGWCNRPLDAIGFFRRLETAITRVTGAEPRQDERSRDAGRPPACGSGAG